MAHDPVVWIGAVDEARLVAHRLGSPPDDALIAMRNLFGRVCERLGEVLMADGSCAVPPDYAWPFQTVVGRTGVSLALSVQGVHDGHAIVLLRNALHEFWARVWCLPGREVWLVPEISLDAPLQPPERDAEAPKAP